MELTLSVIAAAVVALLIILFASVRVVPEYERGVIFRLGRLMGAAGRGCSSSSPSSSGWCASTYGY